MAVQHKQQCMPNVSGGRMPACCAKGPGFEPASPGFQPASPGFEPASPGLKHRRRTQEFSKMISSAGC